MTDIYALIENNAISIYPLTEEDINNRNAPTELYIQCYFEPQPTIDPIIEYLEEVPSYSFTSVDVNYIVRRKTVETLFDILSTTYGVLDGNNVLVVDINNVPTALITGFITLIKDRVQNNLDVFARTRQYDDIRSVITYYNSTITSYRDEAIRAVYLRDTCWDNLHTYLDQVTAGTVSVPLTWTEIEAILPSLTW
jgi:hypothetical protein